MSAKASPSEKLGKELAAGIRDGDIVGLGSGSTVARLLPAMVEDDARQRASRRPGSRPRSRSRPVAQELKVHGRAPHDAPTSSRSSTEWTRSTRG